MDLFETIHQTEHEEVVFCHNKDAGLKAMIAIMTHYDCIIIDKDCGPIVGPFGPDIAQQRLPRSSLGGAMLQRYPLPANLTAQAKA